MPSDELPLAKTHFLKISQLSSNSTLKTKYSNKYEPMGVGRNTVSGIFIHSRYIAAREDPYSHESLMALSGLNTIPILSAHNPRSYIVSLSLGLQRNYNMHASLALDFTVL